jgi:hypothetical protein
MTAQLISPLGCTAIGTSVLGFLCSTMMRAGPFASIIVARETNGTSADTMGLLSETHAVAMAVWPSAADGAEANIASAASVIDRLCASDVYDQTCYR